MRPAAWVRCGRQCAGQFQRSWIETEAWRQLAVVEIGSQGGRDRAATAGKISCLHGSRGHKRVRLYCRHPSLRVLVCAEKEQLVPDDASSDGPAELVAFERVL